MSPAKIDAKAAILVAKRCAEDLLKWTRTDVEEIERDMYKKRDVWSITLSGSGPISVAGSVITGPPGKKEYKRFLVDAATGEFEGMRIRELLAS